MNGKNMMTGIVHKASKNNGFLLQTCGRTNTLVALAETTEDATCKRCIPATVKPVPAPKAPAAAKSTGPVAWGIFNADGTFRVMRSTKKEALAVIAHLGIEGLTTRKI